MESLKTEKLVNERRIKELEENKESLKRQISRVREDEYEQFMTQSPDQTKRLAKIEVGLEIYMQ